MVENILQQLTLLEILGTAFSVVQVILSRQNNVNNYLFGIAGILIGMYVYYHAQLYADIVLNTYYLIMSMYGWFFWKYGKDHRKTPISKAVKTDYIKAFLISISCFFILFYWLSTHTDSNVPIWDSLISAFAFAGMWLMAKRKLENWLFLNISNAIAIPLMIYKELYVYAGLTVFLFIMAVSGYLKWKKLIAEREGESI